MDKSWAYLAVGRIFSVIFSVVSIKAITHLFTPTQVGHYYLIAAIISWFSLVLVGPVGNYYGRHVHAWLDEKLLKSAFSALNKYLVLCSVFSVFIILFLNFFSETNNLLMTLVLIVPAYTFFSSWFQTLGPTLNLLGKRKEFVLSTFWAQLLGLVFALFFFFYFSRDVKSWFWGILLGQMIVCFFLFKTFEKDFFSAQAKPGIFFNRELLVYSFPIALSTVLIWTQTQGYRVIVERLEGAELLAFIGVPLALATSASGVVEGITSQYFYPHYYSELRYEAERRRAAWETLWRGSVGVYLPVMLFVASLGGIWIKLLTAPHYHSTVTFFKIGVISELFRMSSFVVHAISLSEKKTKKSILPHVLATAVIVLGLFFIHKVFPITLLASIPLVLLFAYVLSFVFAYFYMRKIMDFSIAIPFLIRQSLFSSPFIAWMFLSSYFNFKIELCVAAVLAIYLYVLLKRQLKPAL